MQLNKNHPLGFEYIHYMRSMSWPKSNHNSYRTHVMRSMSWLKSLKPQQLQDPCHAVYVLAEELKPQRFTGPMQQPSIESRK